MMLEHSVFRSSGVVLMSLSLSRTAIVAHSDVIGIVEWSLAEALAWLTDQNLDGLGLPMLLQREIGSVLDIATRRPESASETKTD